MNQTQNDTCDICKSLIKTYNAFWIDELPEDLKEACWNEASNCCEGDKCQKLNTKMVLMKLVENHKNQSTLQSKNIDGPFTVYWHKEYKKIIYLFEQDTSIETNTLNQDFLNILLDNPIAFIDLYIQESNKNLKESIEQPKLSQIHFTNNIIKPNNALFNFLNETTQHFTKQEISPKHIEKLISFCNKHESILQIFVEKDDSKFINFWKSQIITDILLKGVIESLKLEIDKFFRYEIVLEMLKLRSIFFHTGKTILDLIQQKQSSDVDTKTIPKITPKTYLRITRMLLNITLKINQLISNFYIMSDIFKIFDNTNERPKQAYNIIIYSNDSIEVAKYQMFLETFGFTQIEN